MGHEVGETSVRHLLDELGYSLQANAKVRDGTNHPNRNAQFEYINAQAQAFLATNEPVVSVDTKKKELVGDYKNGGREWQPKGQRERVQVHDFIDREIGRAILYGVYDVARDEGWVSVGIDHAVAESFFATLRAELVDHKRYPTRAAAMKSIGDYIDNFYNVVRRHSYLGFVDPVEFELRSQLQQKVA